MTAMSPAATNRNPSVKPATSLRIRLQQALLLNCWPLGEDGSDFPSNRAALDGKEAPKEGHR